MSESNGQELRYDNAVELLSQALSEGRTDSIFSQITGFGSSRDKRETHGYIRKNRIQDESLETLYLQNDMAARIVETLPKETLRAGYRVNVSAEDELEAIETGNAIVERLRNLGANEDLVEAMIWGRLFGGGAIYILVDDGVESQEEPLELDRIRSIVGFQVLDRRELMPLTLVADPMDARFGQPEVYQLQPQVVARAQP